eukprot:2800553-Amphidinium_carterae.1
MFHLGTRTGVATGRPLHSHTSTTLHNFALNLAVWPAAKGSTIVCRSLCQDHSGDVGEENNDLREDSGNIDNGTDVFRAGSLI